MKIIFYGRTQVGSVVLSYLVAQGHEVKVIPEDEIIQSLIEMYELEEVTLETMGEFDLFVCCHGEKVIKQEHLDKGTFINMHSCLFKYKGKDPISRYIENDDRQASIESHYMTNKIDEGEVIWRVFFDTPKVLNHGQYFNLAIPHYYTCIHETMKELGWGKHAAMTRYHQEPNMLKGWLEYYSKYFQDLYVFGDVKANKPEVDPLLKEYKAKWVRTDDLIYSEPSHQKVFQYQKKLLKTHEWVIYTDMDERVVADPSLYKDLTDYMKRSRDVQPFCEGWEIIKHKDQEKFDFTKEVFPQRNLMCRDLSGSYNKPALSKVPTNWALGFHYIEPPNADFIKSREKTGLYMFHLKNVDALEVPKHCYKEGKTNEELIKYIPVEFKGLF